MARRVIKKEEIVKQDEDEVKQSSIIKVKHNITNEIREIENSGEIYDIFMSHNWSEVE